MHQQLLQLVSIIQELWIIEEKLWFVESIRHLKRTNEKVGWRCASYKKSIEIVSQQGIKCPDTMFVAWNRHEIECHVLVWSQTGCLLWPKVVRYTLKIMYCKFFHHSGFLTNLRLPWKTEFALQIFTVLNILFTYRIFEQLVLALKNRVCPEFTVLNIYFLSFRIFEQLALALKTEFVLKFFKPGGGAAAPPRTLLLCLPIWLAKFIFLRIFSIHWLFL